MKDTLSAKDVFSTVHYRPPKAPFSQRNRGFFVFSRPKRGIASQLLEGVCLGVRGFSCGGIHPDSPGCKGKQP